MNRLAARGHGRSGAKGFKLRKNQLDFDRNFADSLSQTMSQIGGMYSGYTQNEYARQAALMQAAMSYWTQMSGQQSSTPQAQSSISDSRFANPTATGRSYNEMGDSYPIYDFGGGWRGF